MIYISSVLGGPELEGSNIDRAIKKAVDLRGAGVEGSFGSLDVVFHVPGSILRPDYQGIRMAKFSRKERMLMVQIGVPPEMVMAQEAEGFVIRSLRQAVKLAGPRFAKAGVTYSESEYLDQVDKIAQQLLNR